MSAYDDGYVAVMKTAGFEMQLQNNPFDLGVMAKHEGDSHLGLAAWQGVLGPALTSAVTAGGLGALTGKTIPGHARTWIGDGGEAVVGDILSHLKNPDPKRAMSAGGRGALAGLLLGGGAVALSNLDDYLTGHALANESSWVDKITREGAVAAERLGDYASNAWDNLWEG